MPWSNGVYTRTNGVFTGTTVWAQDAAAGTNITTSHHDTHDQDLATGLNNCVTVDGLNQIQANFVPKTGSTYNLGSSSYKWQNLYVGGTVSGGATYSSPILTTPSFADSNSNAYVSASHGGVRLVYSSDTEIIVSPYGSGMIQIAGDLYQVPSGGVTAANTGVYVGGTANQSLSDSTLYYVYLFDNSGTLTVNFSTTAHSTDTTAGNVGVEIMTGNNAYTLVGMIYTNASGEFADAAGSLTVLSWFNRRPRKSLYELSQDETTTDTSYQIANGSGAPTTTFLNWSDGAVDIVATSIVGNTATYVTYIGVGLDGTETGTAVCATIPATGDIYGLTAIYCGVPSEGKHLAQLMFTSSSASGTAEVYEDATVLVTTWG